METFKDMYLFNLSMLMTLSLFIYRFTMHGKEFLDDNERKKLTRRSLGVWTFNGIILPVILLLLSKFLISKSELASYFLSMEALNLLIYPCIMGVVFPFFDFEIKLEKMGVADDVRALGMVKIMRARNKRLYAIATLPALIVMVVTLFFCLITG